MTRESSWDIALFQYQDKTPPSFQKVVLSREKFSPRFILQAWPQNRNSNKTGAINDPVGQTHSLASSEHCFAWNLFCFARFWKANGWTTCAKTMITTGRDCGPTEWINNPIHEHWWNCLPRQRWPAHKKLLWVSGKCFFKQHDYFQVGITIYA